LRQLSSTAADLLFGQLSEPAGASTVAAAEAGWQRGRHAARVFDFEPTDLVDTPAQSAFRAHSNYVHAFAVLMSGKVEIEPAETLARVAGLVDAVIPRSSRAMNETELRGCLHRAWGAELLLAMGREVAADEDLLRLINSWGVVQAYYAAYSITQALIVAEGRARPTSHSSTQRQAVDLWVKRRFAVAPWSFAMADPEATGAGSDGAIHGPGRPVAEAHPWSACGADTCWDIAALARRSTRDDAVNQALAARRREKLSARRRAWAEEEQARIAQGRGERRQPKWPTRANLTNEEKRLSERSVRPYTLLDYLFRLRVKSNYEDASVFIEGPETAESVIQMARDLELIAAVTLLVHELRVGHAFGGQPFLSVVDDWLETAGATQSHVALGARRSVLGAYL
jgi:hypothetical protein